MPDSRIADGVVAINPTTGEPYTSDTNGAPVSIVGPLPAGSNTIGAITTSQLPATLSNGRLNIEPLGVPGVARQLTAGAASANTALTVGVARISMYARSADIRYAIGSSSQTASATSHFIAAGERLDIDVPSTPNIAVIRAGTTDGTLEITELT